LKTWQVWGYHEGTGDLLIKIRLGKIDKGSAKRAALQMPKFTDISFGRIYFCMFSVGNSATIELPGFWQVLYFG
jgi:hypothetical protein